MSTNIRLMQAGLDPPPPNRGGLLRAYRRTKAVVLKVWFVLLVLLVAWPVVSEGMRLMYPVMSQRLSKLPLPGFSHLKDYEGLHRADLAHVLSAALLAMVAHLWVSNIRLQLVKAHAEELGAKWDLGVYRLLVRALGGGVLLADAALFFYGLSARMGGSWDTAATPTIPSLLMTAAYVGGVVYAAFVTVTLDDH